ATSATRAPGARLSWTIRALSSADQRRRRSGPVKSSSRRKPTFASLLTSNIITAPSPIPRESPAQLNQERKNGRRAPLTVHRWKRPLENGTCIHQRAGESREHRSRLSHRSPQLTLLAPDIVELILDGRQRA